MPHDLRSFARGKPCYLRFPGCSHDPAQTVLAHLRIGNVAGTGMKPPDICGIPADDWCHGILDGRIKTEMTQMEIRAEACRALNQWLADLWANEVIVVVL